MAFIWKIKHNLKSSLYTDVVLFFFTFFVLFENIGEHASEANVRERKIKNVHFLLPTPTSLRRRSINPPGFFIFYHARSADSEEKIEGL